MELSTLSVVVICMMGLFLLGLPIFASLAVAAAAGLLYGGNLPLSVIHNSLFEGLNIFPLLAIPCFVIAGTLMEYGNITNQIVSVVKQIVGRLHGGLGITTILACTFFAAISGSGPGTVAAVALSSFLPWCAAATARHMRPPPRHREAPSAFSFHPATP